MLNPIDFNNDDTRPLDRADLAMRQAVEHLRLAHEQVLKAMQYRAELTLALYYVPRRLLNVAQEISQEVKDNRG